LGRGAVKEMSIDKDIETFRGDRLELIKHSLFYHNKNNLIYLKIGKTAGTSIYKGTLQEIVGKFEPSMNKKTNQDYEWLQNLNQKILDECFCFCFVRNPFDRVVSVATYFKIKPDYFIDNYEKYVTTADNIKKPVNGEIYSNNHIYFHSQPCSIYTHVNGKQAVDFIGKFENIQDDFKKMCELVGIEYKELPHMNKTKHGHYRKYYNDERIEKIGRIYSDDIKYFNYKF